MKAPLAEFIRNVVAPDTSLPAQDGDAAPLVLGKYSQAFRVTPDNVLRDDVLKSAAQNLIFRYFCKTDWT